MHGGMMSGSALCRGKAECAKARRFPGSDSGPMRSMPIEPSRLEGGTAGTRWVEDQLVVGTSIPAEVSDRLMRGRDPGLKSVTEANHRWK